MLISPGGLHVGVLNNEIEVALFGPLKDAPERGDHPAKIILSVGGKKHSRAPTALSLSEDFAAVSEVVLSPMPLAAANLSENARNLKKQVAFIHVDRKFESGVPKGI